MQDFILEVNFRLFDTRYALDSSVNIKFINDENDTKSEFFLKRYGEAIRIGINKYAEEHLLFRRITPFYRSDLKNHASIVCEAISQAMESQITEVSKMSIEDIKKLNLVEKLKQ